MLPLPLLPSKTTFLLILIVLATFLGFLNHYRAEKWKALAVAGADKVAILESALEHQNAVTLRCDAATKKLAAIATAQQMLVVKASEDVERATLELIETRQKLRAKEDADRAIPQCQVVLTASLLACPGHTAGMRERASRPLSRPAN